MPTASQAETSENTRDSSANRLDAIGSGHAVKEEIPVSRTVLEARTKQIGRELFERIGQGPRPGIAPGGRIDSLQVRWTTRWCGSSFSGLSTRCRH